MVTIVAQYRVKRHRSYPAGARVFHLSDGNRFVDAPRRSPAASRVEMRRNGWLS